MKTRNEIQAAIAVARGTQGFAAANDVTDQVMACCTGVSAETSAAVATFAAGGDVGAVPFMLIFQLAMQIVPILFGEGGFTIEKLLAVFELIKSIFV